MLISQLSNSKQRLHFLVQIQTMETKNKPIKKDEEVQQNPDEHIDQDFPGFPHLPADKKSITPVTILEKKLAGIDNKQSKKTG